MHILVKTVNKQKITPLAESEQNMEWGRNTVAVNLRILNFDFLWLYSIEEDSKCIVLCHWQTVTVLLLFQFGLCFSFLGLPKPCWIKMVIMDLLALFLILDGCYQLSTIGNDDPPWNCHFLLWVPFSSFWTQGTLTYSIQFRSGFTSLRKPPQTTVGWLLSFACPHIPLHKISITLFFTLCWQHRYYVYPLKNQISIIPSVVWMMHG